MDSTRLPYTSERAPAPSLWSLVDFLAAEDNGQYLYRGQTRLFDRPLFPSAFRRYRKTGTVYNSDSREYSAALRKVGKHFVGLVPINYFHELISVFCPPANRLVLSMEADLLTRLSNDQYLACALSNGPNAFEMVLTDDELALFKPRFVYWKEVVDYEHRVQIRDMVFMRPFGYLLGQGLAQQYGFSSEMLDVTSNPRVAAFYAAHESPDYRAPVNEGIGVIYRFPRMQSTTPALDLGSYNFYSCPGVLDFAKLLARFTTTEDTAQLRKEVEGFLVASFHEKQWRRWEAFRVSSAILSATRVMRQAAALLVPDAIYVEAEAQGSSSRKIRTLMAIEDCAAREGTAPFYFQHGRDASRGTHITREYLWPNEEDAFFEMIGNALLTSVVLDTGQILPSRIDLLDPGYQM